MKYTIIQINDRSKEQTKINKKYLKNLDYVDNIEFIDGNLKDAKSIINSYKVDTGVWSPYDGRETDPLPGEYGYWASMLNILHYIINEKIKALLVLDDDAELNDNSENVLNSAILDLPDNWDFLSLFYAPGNNTATPDSSIDKKYIHKAINQVSATVATVYSFEGAKKILELAKEMGAEYTFDCFIFKYCKLELLNGYSIIPNTNIFAKHNYDFSKSIIDPDNKRQNVEII
jgi:GR25 family glycosyltransferase involved in LPS biosynthesis